MRNQNTPTPKQQKSTSPARVAVFFGMAAVQVAIQTANAANDNNKAIPKSDVIKIIRDVAISHNINPDDFEKMAVIESNLRSNAFNTTSHAAGVLQFIPSTARRYKLSNPYDVRASAEAGARLWEDNRKALKSALNVEPSGGVLYLSHQQGAVGAAKLLANPQMPAYRIVGKRAVVLNGGTLSMTAVEFAELWIGRFNRTVLPD